MITSSTTTTASPGLAEPSSQRVAPCSLAALRTENQATGCAVPALWKATAAAIGSAPIVGPPIATAAVGRRACTSAPMRGMAAGLVVVSAHSM